MPEQTPDPLQKLSRFGSEFEGGTMPLPAADVRRRGDRIRRRRNALVAGGTALAVAAIATPIFALTGDGGDKDTLPADRPESVATADLLSSNETTMNEVANWFETDTFAGDGQAPLHPCTRESFEGLGATSLQQRTFELLYTGETEGVTNTGIDGDLMTQSVAEFGSATEAQAAYDDYVTWVEDCTFLEDNYERYTPQGTLEVDQPDDGEATIIQANYGPAPADIDPYGDAAYITETGLAVAGDRLTVVRLQVVGQDYNYLPTPMQEMLPVAAELMLPGGDERPQPPRPSAPTSSAADPAGATTFGEGFALDAGWGYDPDSYEITSPATADPMDTHSVLQDACGSSPGITGMTDRLTTSVDGPTSGYTREAWLFSDSAAATRAFADVAQFDDCSFTDGELATTYEVSADAGDTVVGDESTRIVALSTVGGEPLTESTQVWWLTRIDSAILLITAVEEGGGTSAAGNALIDGQVADAEPAIAALQDLVAD